MGLRTGLILGLIIGAAGAFVFAPSRDEEGEGAESERDPRARLRQALNSLRQQAEEACQEAREAKREAEEEMRGRYRESLRQGRRRR
jgi:gas vesicle protein